MGPAGRGPMRGIAVFAVGLVEESPPVAPFLRRRFLISYSYNLRGEVIISI